MDSSDQDQQELRQAFEEAIASLRLEGYVPTQAFERDCEAVIAGKMTFDQARANALARAQRGEIG
jgi:ABC-type branched-subunit amino acid transport system substrate-binding protein